MARNCDFFDRCREERKKDGFFKVLQRVDLSSENMRALPHDFVRNFSEIELTRKMKISTQWGSSWEVDICRNPRFYFMEKSGWERFVRDNALGDQEFLTFNHEGEMRFTVHIFKIDGKETLQPPQSMAFMASASRVKTEQGRCSNPAPRTAAESNGGGNYKRKLNLGKSKAKESQNSERTKNVSVRRDSAGASSSSVAEFTILIKKSYLTYLRIPAAVRKNHMPEQKMIFKIHHLNMKKSWNLGYSEAMTRGCFSAGWLRLAREYPLAVGDTCKFTFLKPDELILAVSKPSEDITHL